MAVAEPAPPPTFGLIEGMIRQGWKADVRTLKSSTSQVISPNGLTAGEYIARCAAEAVSLRPEDVGLAWKRELKARLEDVGDLLAKGDPADLLVALRHGPKIADDVAGSSPRCDTIRPEPRTDPPGFCWPSSGPRLLLALNVGSPHCRNISGVGRRPDASSTSQERRS
jgi:hypothetical protein